MPLGYVNDLNAKVLASFLAIAVAHVLPAEAASLVSAGEMTEPRAEHTATLLRDGRVLITGGYRTSTSTNIAAAEIYDPGTGGFTPTGSMNVPRWGHSAVLLDDGRVLVLGGWFSGFTSATDTAEIYDPATREFSPAGRMSIPRSDLDSTDAVRLRNGNVVILGGSYEGGFGTATPNVDVFSPNSADAFQHIANMALARRGHSVCPVVYPDGRRLILSAGGLHDCCNAGLNQQRLRSAELYNPAQNTSRLLDASMSFPRAFPNAASLPGGRCLIVGDDDNAEVFDPRTETFEAVASRGAGGQLAEATPLADGSVVLSGRGGVSRFDPTGDRVTALIPASQFSRDVHRAVQLRNGRVLITGGEDRLPGAGGGPTRSALLLVTSLPVLIDIKPGDARNSINPCSSGGLPVAVLSGAEFNARHLDRGSLRLAGAGVRSVGQGGKLQCGEQDADFDGRLDLVCQFATGDLSLPQGRTTALLDLAGRTASGVAITGSDTVTIVRDNGSCD